MPPLVAAQLIVEYGIPLTQQIVAWVNSGKSTVTDADFAALVTLSQYRSSDALAAAGIKIVDGKVVPA